MNRVLPFGIPRTFHKPIREGDGSSAAGGRPPASSRRRRRPSTEPSDAEAEAAAKARPAVYASPSGSCAYA